MGKDQSSEEFFAEMEAIKKVQDMPDPLKVQEELVLGAKTTEDIGKLIDEKKITVDVRDKVANVAGSGDLGVKKIVGNFINNEVLTDNWKPKDERDIGLKKELVSNAIEMIVKRDIDGLNNGKASLLNDKVLPSTSKSVQEYIEEKIEMCNNEIDDTQLNKRMDYKDPSTLSHLMKHHPECVSQENKGKIIQLETDYQKQEFGDLIREARVSKGHDDPFSKNEKAAMKLLYEGKNKREAQGEQAPSEVELKQELVAALNAARSKSMRGKLTNIRKSMMGEYKNVISKAAAKASGQSR